MKRVFSLIVAGATGGLIVLIGILSVGHYTADFQNDKDAHLTTYTEGMGRYESVPNDFIAAADKAMPAVVHISVKQSPAMVQNKRKEMDRRDPFSFFFGDDFFGIPHGREGKGSGVIISDDGYIVTNNHVVEMTDQYEVTLFDDRKFSATLVGTDPRTDLAVLKIDANNLPYLKFSNSDKVKVGEWVLAVGNPFDLTSTVTAGIISAKGRHKIIQRNDAIEDFIQTDAVVNPGNSGGALVNAEGDLIGINTAIATATGYYAGYSFAVPANMVEQVVNNLIDYGGPRVTLGVYVATIKDYEEYSEADLQTEKGLVVTDLVDGGAAQYAGILPEDIILKVDSDEVNSADDLVKIMNAHKIGDEITITLIRNGKSEKISVRLKA
ncbi:MAG: trypsin-like peptidase domain-containing protein [Saprospiraceae bacterium]|nr:trypsin-like peptidase domain-containing protein [Saprospiraceae bacterium]